LTSGGDRVYPKGLPVGTVTDFKNDAELGPFLAIKIKPAANLDRLEEVLVVTRIAADAPVIISDPHRTAEILAQRLPGVTKPAENPATNAPAAQGNAAAVPPLGSKAVAGQALPTPTPVKNATNASPGAGNTGPISPAGNKAVAGQALPTPTPVKKATNASPGAGNTGPISPAGNKAVAGQASPTPTPVKKKKPSLPPSDGSQASPTGAPPAESSQPDSVVKPKPQPSPATNGEKPPL
jgi:rod shape-determining protein MreC